MARVLGFLEAHRRLVVGGVLGLVLLAGILAFRDYGIAWDEPVQRQYGSEVYGFIAHHDQALFSDRHRYYGPVFELVLYSLEKAFGLTDTRPVYMMRHLVSFLALGVGAFFFYLLGARVFRNWKVGLLGSVFLVLSPRIFAHAFYNSKDIPFMAMFIVGVYTMLRYLDSKTFALAIVHGAVCGALIDLRIVGVMLVAMTAGFWTFDALRRAHDAERGGLGARRGEAGLLAYIIVTGCVTVLLWPTLWKDPLGGFLQSFKDMGSFPWEATVLYLGKYVWSTRLPWHYTPMWIGVSTPLAYLAFLAVGVVVCALAVGNGDSALFLPEKGRCPLLGRDAAVLLLWFLLPLVYFPASRAVLYDEWRHSFFIYPALLLIALAGLVWLWRLTARRLAGGPARIASAALIFLVALSLGSTATFMIRHHPFQNVYFNSLVGGTHGASGKFEMDYWGLSYRQGLEHLAATDPSPRITVFSAHPPGRYNADILKPADRRRIVYVPNPADAKYYVTNFRWETNKFSPESEVFTVEVGGVKLMAVYRL
jgi:hypothetical protein